MYTVQYRHQGRIQLFIRAKAFRDRRMGERTWGWRAVLVDKREWRGRQTGPEGSIYKVIVI